MHVSLFIDQSHLQFYPPPFHPYVPMISLPIISKSINDSYDVSTCKLSVTRPLLSILRPLIDLARFHFCHHRQPHLVSIRILQNLSLTFISIAGPLLVKIDPPLVCFYHRRPRHAISSQSVSFQAV